MPYVSKIFQGKPNSGLVAPSRPVFVPPPDFGPARAPRGSRAAGLTYQRKLAGLLEAQSIPFVAGPWIREPSGALAQPDLLATAYGRLFVIEAKLAQNDGEAVPQLVRYARLLRAMGFAEPVLVQATKWLRHRWARTHSGPSFVALARLARPGDRWLWHWLG